MAKISLGRTELDSASGSLILGAPGSGKTSALVGLVRELEGSGVKPDEILVLTPSRLAANKLRDQIGVNSQQAAQAPRARSLSSFAFFVLSQDNPDLKLLSGASQQALLAELIAAALKQKQNLSWGIDALSCQLQGFQTEVRDLISVVVENQLGIEELGKLQLSYPKSKLQVAIDLLPKYREALAEQNAMDPSELVVRAIAKLSQIQPPKYLLVDDSQDISPAGLNLVAALADHSTGFIFGDPDAAVLGFRSGAESFVAKFSNLARHYLEQPVATAEKLSLLQKVSARIPVSLAVGHRPKQNPEAVVSAELFDNQSAEADWLAAKLRRAKLIDQIDWDQMAVVARTRTQLDQLAHDLSARGVPVRIVGVQQALKDQLAARAILDFGALVYQLKSEVDRLQLLGSPIVGLDALGIRRLMRELSQLPDNQGVPRSQIQQELFSDLIDSESFEAKALNRATETRLRLANRQSLTAHEFVSELTGLMNLERLRTLSRGRGPVALAAGRDLDGLLELFAAAQRFDLRSEGFADEFVANQLLLSIPEDSLAPIGLRSAVTLATSAQLAGTQYELVAIPRLQEGIWPNLKPRSSLLGASSLQAYLLGRSDSPEQPAGNELADEIRSFYKAIGAYRSQLLLSAMSAQDEQPSQFFTMFKIQLEQNESEVDFDIRRQVGKLRALAMRQDRNAIATLATLSLAGVPGAHPRNWQGLQPISSEQPVVAEGEALRLSASKLEAFEKCPLHWFIGSFGGQGKSFQASLGTLLHAALEANSRGVELADFVQSNWHTLEFESKWQELAEARRSSKMLALVAQYLQQANQLLAAEQPFELEVGALTVVGKIDRVEISPAGALVVDLKTGKTVPTQNEVLANRQLALYQLALKNAGQKVTGAKIVAVGGESLRVIEQHEIEGEQLVSITNLLERAATEIGSDQFAASISSHCAEDGNCQLLLAKAVQHG
jgi:superfamily I DNA/RNA helicase/RecB family exonuclease